MHSHIVLRLKKIYIGFALNLLDNFYQAILIS